MFWFLLIAVVVFGIIIFGLMRSVADFPEYYAPECFDCNKGFLDCYKCRYKRW